MLFFNCFTQQHFLFLVLKLWVVGPFLNSVFQYKVAHYARKDSLHVRLR